MGLNKIKTEQFPALVVFLSAVTLIGAFGFEYIGGLEPCALCLQQRVPYWIAIALGLTAVAVQMGRQPAIMVDVLVAATGALFIGGAILAAYHAGAEWKWWPGPATCSSASYDAPATIEELRRQLEGIKIVPCDEAAWRLFGLSLAGYNFLISLAMAAIAFVPMGRRFSARTWV